MKISCRPLKAEAFELEVDPEDTVEVVKAKIHAVKPDLAPASQKLVYSGKVLQDGQKMQDHGVKDGDFIVIMLTKAKAAEPPAPAAAPAVPAAASSAAPAPAPAAAMPAAPAAAGSFGQGGTMEGAAQMLCDMGFPRSEVERCLRAAFGNADRAVEYLMSGIPPAVLQQQQQAAAAAAAPPAAAPPQQVAPAAPAAVPAQVPAAGASPFPQLPGAARGAPAAGAGGPLALLRAHPRFAQLRMVAQQSPQMLNQVLSALAQTDPHLINLIAEHQDEFVHLLGENPSMPPMAAAAPSQVGQTPAPLAGGPAPPAGGAQPLDPIAAMLAAAQAAQAGQAGGAPAMPAAPAAAPAAAAPPSVALTAAEQEAIGRLQALGFPRNVAVEAFLACDRNEEIAANFLFESAED